MAPNADDQMFQMLQAGQVRIETALAEQGKTLTEFRLESASLGIAPRLKALEDFKTTWEPKLLKVSGIVVLLSALGSLFLRWLWH